jgi:hypothetical protein
MTLKIPKRTETIKRRIKEYEDYLKAEKRRFGCYDDSGGIRYLIGPFYMLAGDVDGALKPYSNIPTKKWAEYIPPEIYNLWDEEAAAWLKESFYAEKTQCLMWKYNDIGKRLETEPVGPERNRLVRELSSMERIEII